MKPGKKTQTITCLLSALSLTGAAPSAAQSCPSSRWSGAPVGSVAPERRLHFIRQGLALGRSHTRGWATTWGIVWGTATGAQLAAMGFTSDIEQRKDFAVGSASAALGLVPTWIAPPRIIAEDPGPQDGAAGRDACGELLAAEARLDRYAEDDAQYSGWVAHASNLAVNAAVSLVLGFGFQHRTAAITSSAVGVPVGALMILTYPSAGSRLRERYLHGELGEGLAPQESFLERTRWSAIPLEGGGALAVSLGF